MRKVYEKKECKKCTFNVDGNCTWGKSKDKKVIISTGRRKPNCKLLVKQGGK